MRPERIASGCSCTSIEIWLSWDSPSCPWIWLFFTWAGRHRRRRVSLQLRLFVSLTCSFLSADWKRWVSKKPADISTLVSRFQCCHNVMRKSLTVCRLYPLCAIFSKNSFVLIDEELCEMLLPKLWVNKLLPTSRYAKWTYGPSSPIGWDLHNAILTSELSTFLVHNNVHAHASREQKENIGTDFFFGKLYLALIFTKS